MILVYNKVVNRHYIEDDDFECTTHHVPILRSSNLELINQTEQKMNEGLNYRCFNCGDADEKTYKASVYDNSHQYFCAHCFKQHVAVYPYYMAKSINDKALREIEKDEKLIS